MKTLVDVEKLYILARTWYGKDFTEKLIKLISSKSLIRYPAEILTAVCSLSSEQSNFLSMREREEYINHMLDDNLCHEIRKFLPGAQVDPSMQDLYREMEGYRKTILMIDNSNSFNANTLAINNLN